MIDWMLTIPPEMQNQLLDNIEALEKELTMPYMNPFEKRGLERGAMDMIKFQLEQRFGPLPPYASDQLEHASQADLKRWGAALLSAPTLDDVFASH